MHPSPWRKSQPWKDDVVYRNPRNALCWMLTFSHLLRAKWLNEKSHLSFFMDRCILLHGVHLLGKKEAAYDVCISSRFIGKRGLLLDESEKSHDVLFERPKFIMRNTMYDTSTWLHRINTRLTGSGAEETMQYGVVAFTFNPYNRSTTLEG